MPGTGGESRPVRRLADPPDVAAHRADTRYGWSATAQHRAQPGRRRQLPGETASSAPGAVPASRDGPELSPCPRAGPSAQRSSRRATPENSERPAFGVWAQGADGAPAPAGRPVPTAPNLLLDRLDRPVPD